MVLGAHESEHTENVVYVTARFLELVCWLIRQLCWFTVLQSAERRDVA